MLCDLVQQGVGGRVARQRSPARPRLPRGHGQHRPARHPGNARLSRRPSPGVRRPSPAPPAAWPFSSGTTPRSSALADALGFRYAYDPGSGQYAHPAVPSSLTPDGRISRYLYGVKFRPLDVRLALVEAAHGKIGSIVDRVLLTCFRYDPATRTLRPLRPRRHARRRGADAARCSVGDARRCCGGAIGARGSRHERPRGGHERALAPMLFLPPQASTSRRDRPPALLRDHHDDGRRHRWSAVMAVVLRRSLPRARRRTPARARPAPRAAAVDGGRSIASASSGCSSAWWVIGFAQYVRLRVAPPRTRSTSTSPPSSGCGSSPIRTATTRSPTLYVPAGRPIKLIMTRATSSTASTCPTSASSRTSFPGRYTTLWFEVNEPGTHQILCAEYCGTGHSTMRGEVVALDPADYARWLGSGLDRTRDWPAPTTKSPRLRRALEPRRRR